MADINKLIPFILKYEGGFSNDPTDSGGATNKGVTLKTFRRFCAQMKRPEATIKELKNISDSDWHAILKIYYWDRWKADLIQNQSLANLLVDWLWTSGIAGIKRPQRLLGVSPDGKVGPLTLAALNSHPTPRRLFALISQSRREYIDEICRRRPANARFRKGWLNRLNALCFSDE